MKKIFLPLLLLVSASVLANWQYPQYNPDGEAKDYGNHLDEYHQSSIFKFFGNVVEIL